MTLLISAIALILIIGMSEANISVLYQFQNNEANYGTRYVAESCLEEALIRLEEDPSFSGAEISIETYTCGIIVSGSNPTNIAVSIVYGNYEQNYQGQVSITTNGQANNIELLNWYKI